MTQTRTEVLEQVCVCVCLTACIFQEPHMHLIKFSAHNVCGSSLVPPLAALHYVLPVLRIMIMDLIWCYISVMLSHHPHCNPWLHPRWHPAPKLVSPSYKGCQNGACNTDLFPQKIFGKTSFEQSLYVWQTSFPTPDQQQASRKFLWRLQSQGSNNY